MRLIIGMLLIVVASGSMAQTCYKDNGESFTVPDKKKIVLVPWWWETKRIVYPMKGVHNPEWSGQADPPAPTEIPEECKNYGQLVVSPTVVPAYCSQYFPEET